jgi:hypothetical protein
MWLGEEAKMGLILSVYYIFFVFVVHLDGAKKLENIGRLSTKLSTIWQIIDYLSKKKSIID